MTVQTGRMIPMHGGRPPHRNRIIGGKHETHQHSRLHSRCVFRFDGMGTAACEQALLWQACNASNGQPDIKGTGRNG